MSVYRLQLCQNLRQCWIPFEDLLHHLSQLHISANQLTLQVLNMMGGLFSFFCELLVTFLQTSCFDFQFSALVSSQPRLHISFTMLELHGCQLLVNVLQSIELSC